MKKPFNVFFAASKAFIQHFTVSATSLLYNNRDLNIRIFVIADKIDAPFFNQVQLYFKTEFNTEVKILDTENIDFSSFKTTTYPKYTYFRLFLADVAPLDVEEAMFMDADVIVTGSINELVELSMTEKYICAVSEVSVEDNIERLNNLGIPVKKYFNAGVILVNIKKWRDEALSQKFIIIAKKFNDRLDWVDQDILNIYFANNWCSLPKTYNAIHLTEKLESEPVIVHFNTYSKPWHYVDTHPYNYLYQKYLKLTPFNGTNQIDFSLKNMLLKQGKLFKRVLRDMGFLKTNKNK